MTECNFISRCNSNSNSLVSSLEEAMDHKVVVYTTNLISQNGSHYQKQKTKLMKNFHYVLKNNVVCLPNIS